MVATRAIAVAVSFLMSSCAEAALSGTYVGKGPDFVIILQVVESGAGKLSGRYERQRVVAGTRIEQLNAAVEGSSDGQTVILQVRPTEVSAGTYVLSGTISGSVLQMRGGGYGQTFELSLAKGTEEDFKNHAARLSATANSAIAMQTVEAELAVAEQTLEAVVKFSSKPEPTPSAFAPYENRYRTLTEGMRVALARQHMIPRFIPTPARGQIGVSINQRAIETAQIHSDIKAKQSEFHAKINAVSEKLAPISRRCADPSAQINIQPQTLEKLKLQCARILLIAKQFSTDIKRIHNSFEKIEAVWREEQEKQQMIVRSADIAAR